MQHYVKSVKQCEKNTDIQISFQNCTPLPPTVIYPLSVYTLKE